MKEERSPIGSCLKTPVLFLVFNRPDTTRRVFEAVREARPERLFVAADGPREGVAGDQEKCRKVREIATSVDWDCEVSTLFRERNLGCRIAVSSAIDWVFEQEEKAIILEDDCLPDPTFFAFCETLLERYREDERIAQIGGDNFQFGRRRGPYSYYFSRYNHIWGWASWRRAWKHYDAAMSLWPEIREGGRLNDWLMDRRLVRYWTYHFEETFRGRIDTWDYPWTFACWVQGALTVLPSVNLVSNIGFGKEGTHTKGMSRIACLKTEPISFPLAHPSCMLRDAGADACTERLVYPSSLLLPALRGKLRRLARWIRR